MNMRVLRQLVTRPKIFPLALVQDHKKGELMASGTVLQFNTR